MGNSQAAGIKTLPPEKEEEKINLPFPLPEKKEHPVVKQVLDLLKENRIGTVGIWGTRGIGKTYVMQQIKNHPSVAAAKFDLVVWWQFSDSGKPPNYEDHQAELANLLNLTLPPKRFYWHDTIHEFLKQKKFLLLLDGLWSWSYLEKIGVPHAQRPHVQVNPNYNVIATTRLESFYPTMEISLRCLDWEESWLLFQKTFGKQVLYSDPFLQSRAVHVAEKCGGLPLALIAAARAMSAMEWEEVMFMPVQPQLREVSNNLFPRLKLTYDSLRDDTLKKCFLLCSLWPDNFPIPEIHLILCWMGHGLINDFLFGSSFFTKGRYIINDLAREGLLELDTVNIHGRVHVKMNGVMRELALWIVSQEKSWIVSAGVGLREASHQAEVWKEAEKISLMYNKIKCLPHHPDSPNLSALILQHNHDLRIPNDFFQSMPSLTYLDLSGTASFSPCVTSRIPSLTGLLQLRYLDLSRTMIESLPEEMESLTALECLILSETPHLRSIPPGLISKLKELKLLDLYASHYILSNGSADEILERSETGFLTVGATMTTVTDVQKLYRVDSIVLWRVCIKDLVGLTSLNLFEIFNPTMKTKSALCEFTLSSCTSLEEFIMTDENLFRKPEKNVDEYLWYDITHGLIEVEDVIFLNLPKLERITCGNWPYFMIRSLTVCTCSKLKNLTWIKELTCLERLSLEACYGIEQVITEDAVVDGSIFRRLKSLFLLGLPNLEFITTNAHVFPGLEVIRVSACPKLKRLPFFPQIAKNKFCGIQIKGNEQWWEHLVWEQDSVKSFFQPYFEADATVPRMKEEEPKIEVNLMKQQRVK